MAADKALDAAAVIRLRQLIGIFIFGGLFMRFAPRARLHPGTQPHFNGSKRVEHVAWDDARASITGDG